MFYITEFELRSKFNVHLFTSLVSICVICGIVQSSWYYSKINSFRVIQDPSALRPGPDHPVRAYFAIIHLTVQYPLFIKFFTLSVSYSIYIYMFLDFYQPGWLGGGKKGFFLSSPKSLVKMKLYKTNASGKFIK